MKTQIRQKKNSAQIEKNSNSQPLNSDFRQHPLRKLPEKRAKNKPGVVVNGQREGERVKTSAALGSNFWGNLLSSVTFSNNGTIVFHLNSTRVQMEFLLSLSQPNMELIPSFHERPFPFQCITDENHIFDAVSTHAI